MKRMLLAICILLTITGCSQRTDEAKRILKIPPAEATATDISELLLQMTDTTAESARKVVLSKDNPLGRYPNEKYKLDELQYILDYKQTHEYSQVYETLHAAAMG